MIRKTHKKTKIGAKNVIQKVNNSLDKSINYLLIIIVSGSMFLNGYVYTKVSNLEKQINSGINNVAAANQPAANAPQQEAPAQPKQDLTKMPEVSKDDYVRGNRKAEITLVEYSDLECPFCKRFHPTMQQIMKEYGNKVAWVYRHYPLPFHPKAQKSAEATECAGEIGGNDAFWKMTDLIIEKMPDMALTELSAMAGQIGINQSKFQTCLDSGKYAQKIKSQQEGGNKAGVSGTPGTIIITKNGKRDFIPGALPFEQIKTQIDGLLK